MVFERECQPRLEELFYPTEEKRVERSSALSLSNSNQQFASLECLYSCKFFRIFYKRSKNGGFEISISKKFFRLAVERNKTKRRIKEIFRKLSIKFSFVRVLNTRFMFDFDCALTIFLISLE